MTESQMRARSGEKKKQIYDFLEGLQMVVEAKQKLNLRTGFIENVVVFTDMEQYPLDPAPDQKKDETGPATAATPA